MNPIGLSGWLEIFKAVLQFPDAVLRLVLVLKKTPQEVHELLVQQNEKAAAQYEKTGRPSWD